MRKADWLQRTIKNLSTDTCLIWPYGHGQYGYVYYEGRTQLVHRVAWVMAGNELPPPPLEVCHVVCGNSLCFNYRHLSPGTRSDNECDKRNHGTAQVGESHWNAKLTEVQVREILVSPLGYKSLARLYGVKRETIRSIKLRRTWVHFQPFELGENGRVIHRASVLSDGR